MGASPCDPHSVTQGVTPLPEGEAIFGGGKSPPYGPVNFVLHKEKNGARRYALRMRVVEVAKRREGLNKHHGAVFVPERDRPAGRPSTPTGRYIFLFVVGAIHELPVFCREYAF